MLPRPALRDDRGATAVEYGLIAALIAVVILIAIALLGSTLSGVFTGAAGSLTGTGTSAGGAGGTLPKTAYSGAVPLASYSIDLGNDGRYALPLIPGIQYTLGSCSNGVRGGCGGGQIEIDAGNLTTGSGWDNKAATQTVLWTIPETDTTLAASGSFTVRVT